MEINFDIKEVETNDLKSGTVFPRIYKQATTHICQNCNKEFESPLTTLQYFCSKKCRRIVRGGKRNKRILKSK